MSVRGYGSHIDRTTIGRLPPSVPQCTECGGRIAGERSRAAGLCWRHDPSRRGILRPYVPWTCDTCGAVQKKDRSGVSTCSKCRYKGLSYNRRCNAARGPRQVRSGPWKYELTAKTYRDQLIQWGYVPGEVEHRVDGFYVEVT